MITTKIVETIEEYDTDGKLVKRTVTETEETDDNPTKYVHTTSPYMPVTAYCGSAYGGDFFTNEKENDEDTCSL